MDPPHIPPPPPYHALGPLGGQALHLRFTGPFAGETISWDAHFITLDHYRRQVPDICRNFIEVGAVLTTGGGRPLTVVLAVPCFDAPTVLKTVMMVQRYKRLHVGRHLFGPCHPGPA